jgi:lysophospholipase L1-like esterase
LAEALQAAGFSCEVTCCGISGYTSEEMLNGINSPYLQNPGCGPPGEGLAHLLRDAGPFDLVILMVGTNDIGMKMATGISQDFSSRLHNACHALDVPTVLIAPTTVTDGSTNQAANCHPQIRAQARDNRELLAEAMSTWASDNPQVLLSLDCEALVSKSDPHLWESDEIHFSIDGAKQLGRQMASQLEFVLEQLM